MSGSMVTRAGSPRGAIVAVLVLVLASGCAPADRSTVRWSAGAAPSVSPTTAVAGGEVASPSGGSSAAGPAGDTPGPVGTDGPGVAASGGPLGTDAAGRRVVRILGAGDILVHPALTEQARLDARRSARRGLDFAPMFAGVTPRIRAADLALCHLETPLGEAAGPFAGYPRFNAPPQVLDAVRWAGFDGCSTASNHTLDQGSTGVQRTVAALDAAGLGHTGSAASGKGAAAPKIYQVGGADGVRVAHLSYTASLNGLRRPRGREWLVNVINPAAIRAETRRARAAGAQIVVLSLHWGTEYQHRPDAAQRRWARQLAGSGVDLILGHHAHVVQPVTRVAGTWVGYGMGNEIARHSRPVDANREGLMVQATFAEVGPGRWAVDRVEVIPTWVDLAPDIRLVDLPAALADPGVPADRRRVYQASYQRIRQVVLAEGPGAAVVTR
ncbi:CapA family protein [Plantactinospora sp. GCM10030261]|uniref:CapA family protein n=1 Tax=Plantactinospora sp. GCM10030261 TaxID=3273420 RepID=UPI003608DD04